MIQRLTLQILCLIGQYYHLFLNMGVRLDEPSLLAKTSSTTIECLRMQLIRNTDLQRSKLMVRVERRRDVTDADSEQAHCPDS